MPSQGLKLSVQYISLQPALSMGRIAFQNCVCKISISHRREVSWHVSKILHLGEGGKTYLLDIL